MYLPRSFGHGDHGDEGIINPVQHKAVRRKTGKGVIDAISYVAL